MKFYPFNLHENTPGTSMVHVTTRYFEDDRENSQIHVSEIVAEQKESPSSSILKNLKASFTLNKDWRISHPKPLLVPSVHSKILISGKPSPLSYPTLLLRHF